jgi:hypothetical protein
LPFTLPLIAWLAPAFAQQVPPYVYSLTLGATPVQVLSVEESLVPQRLHGLVENLNLLS